VHRPSIKETLVTEMKKHSWNPDTLELKSHPIRWFSPLDPISMKRVLLVGDAAGVDPLFGEGISFALGYGKVAAGAIVESIKKQQFEFTNYQRCLKMSSLGRALTARWVIAQIIYTFRWSWFHFLLWRVIKPVTHLVAKLFVLNWGKRLK
jgi:flavin-dependent dehydrogenase